MPWLPLPLLPTLKTVLLPNKAKTDKVSIR